MKSKAITIGIVLSILFVFIGHTRQDDCPVLTGPYLGQKPPGKIPKLFAPGIFSTDHHDRYASFSPDGKELFFHRRGRQFTTLIMHMNQVNGVWQKPQAAPFSGNPEFRDAGPILSPDGNILVFYSRRPKSEKLEPENNFDIWIVRKQNGVWGNLENAGQSINTANNEEDATIAADGTIYFSSNRSTVKNAKGNYDIFYSKFVDGKYAQAELLQDSINTEHFEGHTFVAPDESYTQPKVVFGF
jgi:hypothetical protein